MGAKISSPLPNLSNNNYMCIALYEFDSMVLLYPDDNAINAVRDAITTYWGKVQESGFRYKGDGFAKTCFQFKLEGQPFVIKAIDTKSESIALRSMISAMLQSLYTQGWKVLVSSDLSAQYDKASWFFQKQSVFPENSLMFSIGLSSTDKLQINGCPPNLHSVIKDLCQKFWVNRIQSDNIKDSSYEIKLSGTPWANVDRKESCSARMLLGKIVQALSAQHYTFYTNSNLKGFADTLFFQYTPSIQGIGEFFVISANKEDRLRLIGTPSSVNNAVKEMVEACWPGGVQDVFEDDSCYELKLKGNPWNTDDYGGIFVRYMMTKIMEKLASIGYFVITGLDMTRKPVDKAVFLFQRGAPTVTQFMCIFPSWWSTIKFINAPQNVVEAGRSVLNTWPLGPPKESKTCEGALSYEAKLAGKPWYQIDSAGHGIHARAFLLELICQFASLGWRLVCSADVSGIVRAGRNGLGHAPDVHSWYFMYDEMMLAQIQAQQKL